MADGMYCLIMIDNFASENQTFKALSPFESRVLLSAANGLGFKEKGYYEFSNRINTLNSQVIRQRRENNNKINLTNKKIESDDNIFFDERDTTIILPQDNHDLQEIENTTELSENKSRSSISHSQSFDFPYYNLAFIESTNGPCNFPGRATGFLISKIQSVCPI